MQVRIKVRPTGLLNGVGWPEAGETIELPDHVAEGMISAGNAEKVEDDSKKKPATEKRPAAKNVETREGDDGAAS